MLSFITFWRAVGWDKFACVDEPGSRLLTMQFLCTLLDIGDGISFRYFTRGTILIGKTLACIQDLTKHEKLISGKHFLILTCICFGKVFRVSHPVESLELMTSIILLLGLCISGLVLLRFQELISGQCDLVLFYAMVRKIKVSPVQPMIKQCLENVKLSGLVECTSLVTRLA